MSLEVKAMSSVAYTKEQLKAITASGTNLLVSASAGSGKTTVLIERIIHKMKVDKWNIDEMLIVTYTEAAAFELKQRLRVKLAKELLSDSSNVHLRKQLPRLAGAQISTFHSFCNSVIQKFFYLMDYDATYKISDDVETSMIALETLETLFENCYEENDEKFMLLINRFSKEAHDEVFKSLLIDMYFKMRTLPFKEEFQQKVLNDYFILDDLSSWKFIALVKEGIIEKLNEAKNYFQRAYALANRSLHPYREQSLEDLKIIEILYSLSEGPMDNMYSYLKGLSFSTFSSKGSSDIDAATKDMIKDFRDKGKDKILKDLKQCFFLYQESSQVKFIKENKVILEALFHVTSLFETQFQKAKRDKNLVDFSDLEEMALRILSSNDSQNDATVYYKDLFKEILIDEFQDTNSMQETIIKSVSKNNNLFMVGDVKQSIYRFRSAEPEIFQTKYKKYGKNEDGELINLNANYRSRKEIIEFVNYLFSQLMDETVGEINYDEAASLIYGQKDYLHKPLNEALIHLHLLEKDKINETKEQKLEKSEIEAHHVAQKIRELIDSHTGVYDFNTKELRAVEYKDIVILSRTKSSQNVYHDVFKKYNIPFLTDELSGYFNSIEVLTITSILKIIDNPLQDIPLIASLRSPIFNVDEKELVQIKIASKADYYYDKIGAYIKIGQDNELVEKLRYFMNIHHSWRERVKNEALSELLFSIYHDTNYYDFVLGQIGGAQRQANLDLLLERAKHYEHLTSNSLFKFIQLINFLNENDKDLPQARTVSDNENLVRFMTIHKSKGLEFPIVFITNLNKKYNADDENSKVLFEKELGIAFSYLDIKNRVKYDTLYQGLIKDKLRKKMLAEEMRLLYVALTRAKERLFLVGTIDDFEKEVVKLAQIRELDEWVLPSYERQATNYLSLILIALARFSGFGKLIAENSPYNGKQEPSCEIKVISTIDYLDNSLETKTTDDFEYNEYTKDFSERLNYVYPHKEKTMHFAKQTIADMKRANMVSDYLYNHEPLILKTPKFVDITKTNATLRGTSIHLFMQHIDYFHSYSNQDLKMLKTQLLVNEIMSEEQLNLVDLEKIAQFLNTDFAKKIKTAVEIQKELPFTTLINSQKVYKDFDDSVDILVQGVIDLFIVFDDYCYLLDFKSDRIKDSTIDMNRLKKQYQVQIDVYKEAMKHIFPNKELKAGLYLLEINKFIDM